MSTINLGPKALDKNIIIDIDASLSQNSIKAPLSIDGCVLWLDASDTSSLTLSSSLVISWSDKSGNANHAYKSSDALRPSSGSSVNGLNAINFIAATENIGKRMEGSFSTAITSNTVFRVFRHKSWGNAQFATVLELNSYNAGSAINRSSDSIQGPVYTGSSYKISWSNINSSQFAAYDIRERAVILTNSTSSSATNLYLDGKLIATSASDLTQSRDRYYLGDDWTSGDAFNGLICEVIIYNRELTIIEKKQVEAYLSAKWAVPLTLDGAANVSYKDLVYKNSLSSMTLGSTLYPMLVNHNFKTIFNQYSGDNIVYTGNATNQYLGKSFSVEWCGRHFARTNSGTNYCIFTNESYQNYGVILRMGGDTRALYFRMNNVTIIGGGVADAYNTQLLAGVIYHYLITFNQSSLKFYINGVLNQTSSLSDQGPAYSNTDLVFLSQGSQSFCGETLIFKLFNIALSADQVSNQYNLIQSRIAAVPSVYTSGIVLWFDSGNITCYPNSGTTAYDLSTNNLSGTMSAITFNSAGPKSFVFNGTSSYLSFGVLSLFNPQTSDFTISVWVHFTAFKANNAVIDLLSSGSTALVLDISDVGNIRCRSRPNSGSGYTNIVTSSTNLSLNTWYNITIVKATSSTTGYVYINGVLDNSNNFSNNNILNTSTGQTYVGYFGDPNVYATLIFNSAIIYNVALSANQALGNYNAMKYRFGY